MFRRRSASATETGPPAWRERFEQARQLILSQRPPGWIEGRLGDLERALLATEADRTRLGRTLDHVDVDRASDDLQHALRSTDPSLAHRQLITSLRERYESIHRVVDQHDDLATAIDRALADVELLAARSVGLGSEDELWRLDRSVTRLSDDIHALDSAHRAVADVERSA